MSRWEGWSFQILAFVVSASGVAYLWMKYFMSTDDPFSVVNHPLQPAMMKTHILAAPFLILVFGMMLTSHILEKLRNGKSRANRCSGILSLVSFALMTLSGYALQVAADPVFSRAVLTVHLVTGFLFAGAYLTHQVISILMVRKHRNQEETCRLAA